MEYLVDDVINIINECFIEDIIFDEISVYSNFMMLIVQLTMTLLPVITLTTRAQVAVTSANM